MPKLRSNVAPEHGAGTGLQRLGLSAGHNVGGADLCDDRALRPTILIVDDHAGFRSSAATLLGREGFDVVGGASDADSALAEVERLRPDVVLVDIQLPGTDGFALAARLATIADPPRVVLTSSRERSAYGSRVAAASARGFIVKRELSGASLAALVG